MGMESPAAANDDPRVPWPLTASPIPAATTPNLYLLGLADAANRPLRDLIAMMPDRKTLDVVDKRPLSPHNGESILRSTTLARNLPNVVYRNAH